MFNPPKNLNQVGIVLATSEDWERVRDIRLRALADAPFAYGSRLEEERNRPESFWRERLERDRAATFLALDGEETIGLVRSAIEPEDATSAELVSMWVAPQARSQGVGRQLVAVVVEWARHHDAVSVKLWVTETNAAARRLYEACGFVLSGGRQTLPSDPSLSEIAMALLLGEDGAHHPLEKQVSFSSRNECETPRIAPEPERDRCCARDEDESTIH
jgi:ribosomal protein S18 acetylase RimI-like enzyme